MFRITISLLEHLDEHVVLLGTLSTISNSSISLSFDKNVTLNFQEKNIELLTHNYFIKNILEIRCMWYEQSGRQQLPYINGESLCKISYHHWFYVIMKRITSIVGPTLSILYFILRFANFMFAVDVVLRYSS